MYKTLKQNMSLISEDVKTVIACQFLSVQNLHVDELSSINVVCDTLATNGMVIVDPADSNKQRL